MKIYVKVFAREDMYGQIPHTRISNPVEYVLAAIASPFEIVKDPFEADLFYVAFFTVGYNEFEVWFKELSIEQQKLVIIGGYHLLKIFRQNGRELRTCLIIKLQTLK